MECFLFFSGLEPMVSRSSALPTKLIKQNVPRCCNRNSDNLMATKGTTFPLDPSLYKD